MAILDRTRMNLARQFLRTPAIIRLYIRSVLILQLGPDVSIFHVALSRRELRRLLCTKVRLRASETKVCVCSVILLVQHIPLSGTQQLPSGNGPARQ